MATGATPIPGLTRAATVNLTASPGCAWPAFPDPKTSLRRHLQDPRDCTQHFIGLADLPEGWGEGLTLFS